MIDHQRFPLYKKSEIEVNIINAADKVILIILVFKSVFGNLITPKFTSNEYKEIKIIRPAKIATIKFAKAIINSAPLLVK